MTAAELTPRNLGLTFGNAWAKTARPPELGAVTDGTVPDETWESIMAAGVRERLDEFPAQHEAYARFLEGFYDGVCAFVEDSRRRSARGRRTRISHDMTCARAEQLNSRG